MMMNLCQPDGWLTQQPVPLSNAVSMPTVLVTEPTVTQNLRFLR